jgi:serine/threonine protein kinase
MINLVGNTLRDRYFLRELVGSGGMADVYLAWDKMRSAKMAIKVLRRDLANNPRFFQMFAKEAELLRKLEHPHIVRLYEFEKESEVAFIVMDWVDGTNVRQAITDRKKPFTLEEVNSILQPVCSALNYAHQNRVFHCDVKPANILLHVDGRVLLTDFGVARLATEKIGGGTPPYMAPEQLAGDRVNAQTDIYSLGITLYEMLSGGRVPFRGDSPSSQGSTTRERIAWEQFNLPLPSIRVVNPDLSAAVETVISTALDTDPGQRFASAMELREAFLHACSEIGHVDTGASTIIKTIISQLPKPPAKTIQHPPPSLPKKSIPSINLPKISPPNIDLTSLVSPLLNANRRGPKLVGRSGEWASQVIIIPQQGLSMGRSSRAQLRLQESSVSRSHASVLRTKRGTYIRDENSSLGTYVNGKRIPTSVPMLLKNGDVIQIGYYQVFEFQEK